MTEEIPEWIKDLKSKSLNFMEDLKSPEIPGYYSYSLSGDLFPPGNYWNLGGSIFALKIYYTLGVTDPSVIDPIAERIHDFQRSNGAIYDPLIYKKSFIRNLLSSVKHRRWGNLLNQDFKRADTRQAYSSLWLYKKLPVTSPFFPVPQTKNELRDFLQGLNWKRPWSAGSHFSHFLFFLKLQEAYELISPEDMESLIFEANKFLTQFYHSKTGTWHRGDVSNREKINGVMKIFTGRRAIDRLEHPNPKKLIDLCLSSTNDEHACDHFNIIYVLNSAQKCLKEPYRKKEQQQFALDRLNTYYEYYFPRHGGFSFRKGKANINYYSANITKGKNEPDIHGTVMFLWGISIILQILEKDKEYDIREFLT